jgi:phosphatidylethanolamine-binding protein (PEBP) family uncharacterized protein
MTPATPPAQPTPLQPRTRPKTMPRRALALGLLCAAALSVTAASSCGESNSTPAAANPPASTPTTPAPASSTSPDSAETPASTSTTSDSHHGRSALAKERARAAFQSLANAKPAPKLTPAQAKRPISDIQLTSPNINTATNTLATENTCYGANHHPTLRWKNIPPGTAEIAIAILSTKPVNNQLFYDWTITGIPPTLHEIPAGQTPPGATNAPNSYGHPTYNICPPPGNTETYAIIIYALPTTLHPTPNTTPTTIHTQIQHTTHHTGLLITTYHHT